MTCLGSGSPFQRIRNRSASVRALVHVALRDDRQPEPAGRLGGVRQHHHRDPGQVEAGLLVGDVVGLLHPEHRRQHRDARLHVGADVTGVDRDRVGLGRREAGLVGAVDQQPPDVLERHPSDDLLDVDASVAERRPFLVGLGDLGPERDDALETLVHLYASTVFSHVAHCAGTPFWSARVPVCCASMDLGKLLGALDGDEIKDVVELVRKNRGLLEQLSKLPELFASFADGLDSAADQARAAGLALVGPGRRGRRRPRQAAPGGRSRWATSRARSARASG